jgi:hypothetical protein
MRKVRRKRVPIGVAIVALFPLLTKKLTLLLQTSAGVRF